MAGAVLLPFGIAVGAGMWAVGFACGDSGCFIANVVTWPVVGLGMIVTGIVLLVAAEDPPWDANRVQRASIAPWLTPGPTGEPEVTGAVGTVTATF